jgi:hypothetical protein
MCVCVCGERERDRAAGKAHLRGILQSTNPFVHVGVFSAGEETVGDFFQVRSSLATPKQERSGSRTHAHHTNVLHAQGLGSSSVPGTGHRRCKTAGPI